MCRLNLEDRLFAVAEVPVYCRCEPPLDGSKDVARHQRILFRQGLIDSVLDYSNAANSAGILDKPATLRARGGTRASPRHRRLAQCIQKYYFRNYRSILAQKYYYGNTLYRLKS
jgi:hypothetical protein